MPRSLLFILFFLPFQLPAQEARTIRFTSAYTSFPDTGRMNGHRYANVLYPAEGHYDDSSVLIIVPPHFKVKRKIDIIFWFHGWHNNIDSSVNYFELGKQLIASGRNAILVVPESAKNAPDSYGGKLEKQDVFKSLLQDVMNELRKEKIINKRVTSGNLVLAGHSGAFRVIAHILQNGGTDVKEVFLFDGMYGQVDKYINWLQADSTHRFINIYTNKGGGTDEVSNDMMKLMTEKAIVFLAAEESEANISSIRSARIVFIHSLKEHNNVINLPDHNLQLFLESCPVLKPVAVPD